MDTQTVGEVKDKLRNDAQQSVGLAAQSDGGETSVQEDSEVKDDTSAAQPTTSSDAGVTADEVRTIVSEVVAQTIGESETRMQNSADARRDELMSAVGESGKPATLQKVTADGAFAYVPEHTPEFVAQYMTPFLWGLAAGLVAFLIGYLWEAFARLIGLSARK